jgi:hypothetical protein
VEDSEPRGTRERFVLLRREARGERERSEGFEQQAGAGDTEQDAPGV